MGELKMNSLILHNAAFLEITGASGPPIKSSTLARLKNISAVLAAQQIDMIAEVGPYYSFSSFEGLCSRRRDCHSAAPPSPFSGCFNRDEGGVQQNDSLADG